MNANWKEHCPKSSSISVHLHRDSVAGAARSVSDVAFNGRPLSAGPASRTGWRPDLDPAQRVVLLERECDGDEALRREIESLLDSDERTGGFIEEPISAIPRDLFPATEESVAGRKFGAYQVIREIGRGGLGVVYLAARADDNTKSKSRSRSFGAGSIRTNIRRFRTERQILAQLDHPKSRD